MFAGNMSSALGNDVNLIVHHPPTFELNHEEIKAIAIKGNRAKRTSYRARLTKDIFKEFLLANKDFREVRRSLQNIRPPQKRHIRVLFALIRGYELERGKKELEKLKERFSLRDRHIELLKIFFYFEDRVPSPPTINWNYYSEEF